MLHYWKEFNLCKYSFTCVLRMEFCPIKTIVIYKKKKSACVINAKFNILTASPEAIRKTFCLYPPNCS